VCLFGVSAVSAAEKDEDVLAEIAPLLAEGHFAVVRIDVAAVDLDAVIKELDDALVKAGGDKLSTNTSYLDFKQRKADFTKAGGKALYVLMGEPTGQYMVITMDKKNDPAALAKVFEATLIKAGPAATEMNEQWQTVAKVHTGLLLLGMRRVVDNAVPADPVARPDLAKAMAAAGDAPVAVAIVPPQKMVKMLVDQMPNLPEELGGGPTAPLGQIAWASIGVSPSKKTPVTVTVKCESAKAAKDLKTLLDTLLPAFDAMVTAEMERQQQRDLEQQGAISAGVRMSMSPWALILMQGKELNLQARSDTVTGRMDEKGKAVVINRVANMVAKEQNLTKQHRAKAAEGLQQR